MTAKIRFALGAAALAAVVAPVVAATPSGAAPLTAAASCAASHWVSSWAFAPSDSTLAQPVIDQTLRAFAIPHLSGTRVRLHLTNRYSSSAVAFGRVTIANQASGAAIRSATLQIVTVAGRSTFTIPAGGDVTSDPIAITATAFDRLAVSMYVPGTAMPTEHFLSEQTSYQSAPASGDHSTDASAAAFVAQTPVPGTGVPQGISYLSGLDVQAPASVGAVAAFGDSITDGFQGMLGPVVPSAAPIDKQGRWPDRLAVRLTAARRPLTTFDEGISSNQLTAYNPATPFAGPPGLSRFDTDVLAQSGVSDVIVLEGINDIGQSGTTAAALIAAYTTLIARVHHAGLPIQLGTLTPQNGTLQPGYSATAEPTRNQVNAWIRTQRLSDGIIDFDRAVRDPADPSRILPAYDGGDHLHFSLAGYQAMADAVPLDLLAAPVCTRTGAPGTGATAAAGTASAPVATAAGLAASGIATGYRLLLAAALVALGAVITAGAGTITTQLTRTTPSTRRSR